MTWTRKRSGEESKSAHKICGKETHNAIVNKENWKTAT